MPTSFNATARKTDTGLRAEGESRGFKTDEPREKREAFADLIEDRCPIGATLTEGVKLVRASVVRDWLSQCPTAEPRARAKHGWWDAGFSFSVIDGKRTASDGCCFRMGNASPVAL